MAAQSLVSNGLVCTLVKGAQQRVSVAQ
jgi:hypothetical protein